MTTLTRPRYPSLGPGQPPQRPSRAAPPPAYCIQCREGVVHFAPQRPMCLVCWLEEYAGQSVGLFRDDLMAYCHGCGEQADGITFGSPLCQACEEDCADWAV